ncbi:MAG: YobA family protein [Oscillospiraceae bacterium]|nr:YobA family protein [Oscillospiraceae bacterium]
MNNSKSDRLFKAIGMVGDDKVTEVEQMLANKNKKIVVDTTDTISDRRHKTVVYRFMPAMLALFLLIGGSIAAGVYMSGKNPVLDGNNTTETSGTSGMSENTDYSVNTIGEEYSFTGVVIKVYSNEILVMSDDMYKNLDNSTQTYVSTKYADGEFYVGDTVEVFYNGFILDSYPSQLGEVYSVHVMSRDRRPDDYYAFEWDVSDESGEKVRGGTGIGVGMGTFMYDVETVFDEETEEYIFNTATISELCEDGTKRELFKSVGRTVYVADMNGDGFPEFCFIGNRPTYESLKQGAFHEPQIVVYDYHNDKFYYAGFTNQNQNLYHSLSLENGKIMVTRVIPNRSYTPPPYAVLAVVDDELVDVIITTTTVSDGEDVPDAPPIPPEILDELYLGMTESQLHSILGQPQWYHERSLHIAPYEIGTFFLNSYFDESLNMNLVTSFDIGYDGIWSMDDLITKAVKSNHLEEQPTGTVLFVSYRITEIDADKDGFTVKVISQAERFLPDGEFDVKTVYESLQEIEMSFVKSNVVYGMYELTSYNANNVKHDLRETLKESNRVQAMEFFVGAVPGDIPLGFSLFDFHVTNSTAKTQGDESGNNFIIGVFPPGAQFRIEVYNGANDYEYFKSLDKLVVQYEDSSKNFTVIKSTDWFDVTDDLVGVGNSEYFFKFEKYERGFHSE